MRKSGNTSSAVMSQRRDPLDALDDFPTPPWATRALCTHVLPTLRLSLEGRSVWEPAAGRGIMAAVLDEYARRVWASDVHGYAEQHHEISIGAFVGEGLDVMRLGEARVDWIITNPPFNSALEFVERALPYADIGVAMLCRSNWAEGGERFERLFSKQAPTLIAQFVERVPMLDGGHFQEIIDVKGETVRARRKAHRGGYDPHASTATSYAWFVWSRSPDLAAASLKASAGTRFLWIPPCREALTHTDDARRFGKIKRATEALDA